MLGDPGDSARHVPCSPVKPEMSPKASKSFTVLVFDDDPSVLATYRRLLDRSGYRTMAVDDPRRVLEACYHDQPIDLLLLDYKMPGMDGLTLLAELRRRDCRAKCVLLSAFVNDEVVEVRLQPVRCPSCFDVPPVRTVRNRKAANAHAAGGGNRIHEHVAVRHQCRLRDRAWRPFMLPEHLTAGRVHADGARTSEKQDLLDAVDGRTMRRAVAAAM